MNTKNLFVVCTMALTGCTATVPMIPTHTMTTSFDAEATRAQLLDGPNTIKGNSFMRQKGGGIVTCAGQSVYLVPATPYATERVRVLYGNIERGFNPGRRQQFTPDPPEYRQLVKTARCDAQGNFTFERVADGDFYINTSVVWQVAQTQQGGQLMQSVKVMGGQSISLVIAP